MLEVARARVEGLDNVTLLRGRLDDLPIHSDGVDLAVCALVLHHVRELGPVLAEARRVLRPGGRLVVLEFDRPAFAPVRWLNDLYCGWVMPRTATLISGDRSGAYRYLPASVGTFMPRAAMRQAVERAGFSQVRDAGLTLGICVCYSGVRA